MKSLVSESETPSVNNAESPSQPIEIIVMRPYAPHKHSPVVWTIPKIAAVVLAMLMSGGGLWWWGNALYGQYQEELLVEQHTKALRMAKNAAEQQKIQQAWLAHIEHQRALRNQHLKETEEAHIAWDNYYKAQAATKEQKH